MRIHVESSTARGDPEAIGAPPATARRIWEHANRGHALRLEEMKPRDPRPDDNQATSHPGDLNCPGTP